MTDRPGPPTAAIDLVAARVDALLLGDRPPLSIDDVVEWFGAMQGQDLASVSWSIALRTAKTSAQVADAFASGSIVRTWPMRGTLHVVPGGDAAWMVKHLGRRALAGAQRRRESLGLDGTATDRAVEALADALQGGPKTRAECAGVLQAAGVDTAGQRTYHLLGYAAARGLICVGPDLQGEQTFVRLDSLAHEQIELDRDHALTRIAERFVRSHGPVSDHDLARWADLSLTDARAALAAAKGVVRRTVAGRPLFLTESSLDEVVPPVPAALALPGFDEFVLGYRDRSAQLSSEHERLVIPGGNGVFAPTLVVAGRVVGTWRRRILMSRVVITATAFGDLAPAIRSRLEGALAGYGRFLEREPEIRWTGHG